MPPRAGRPATRIGSAQSLHGQRLQLGISDQATDAFPQPLGLRVGGGVLGIGTPTIERGTLPGGTIAGLQPRVPAFGFGQYLGAGSGGTHVTRDVHAPRSEEHTSELQSLMRISYAVFCLKKKNM